ncbi:preprotein translocase subunit TatB [Colwellia sp. MT41]|uniref:Sec-independent protein translocase protein TatB n=1 Tax=Colwellia sp. MT41 TaxID=58049 RepID=UPI0007175D9C|nr:Sec-independent protein translocase protein TatB [Colwellia sp. MT41]ALO33411.1 preprotein translocase subunit TatB [Colwellia sp. MT41]
MFDVGFWELILIAIMGLVILGPERLPVAIRTLRGWITGARKFSDTVKAELTEELRIHELHANLKKAEESGLKNLSPEVAESLKTLQEAAASVTEPFKKVDNQALDAMTSSSLASSANTKAEQDDSADNATVAETSSAAQSAEQSIKVANPESDKRQS